MKERLLEAKKFGDEINFVNFGVGGNSIFLQEKTYKVF